MMIVMAGMPCYLGYVMKEWNSTAEEGKDYLRLVGVVQGTHSWKYPSGEETPLMVELGLVPTEHYSQEDIDTFFAREDIQAMLMQAADLRNKLVYAAQKTFGLDETTVYDEVGMGYVANMRKRGEEASR